jgi:hypothetical protein
VRIAAFRHPLSSILCLLCIHSCGCTTTVAPPKYVRDPVTVAFTDYGRHTSLILPAERGRWVEYAAGDWSFFALGHNQILVGVKALLGLGQWTIGRRYLNLSPEDPTCAEKLEVKRVVVFRAERASAEALRETLDALFNMHRDQMFYSTYSGLYHVTGNESYNLFHDCNRSTAEWLRLLGCDVSGLAITSNFDLEEEPQMNTDKHR